MSALGEALVAAQRRSLATLEKAYVAGAIEAEPMIELLRRGEVDGALLVADDYDRVWSYDRAEEQARWDEAQLEARDVSADRFEREHGEDVP